MLDIGWSEFLVIGVVALVVIGPRELPGALRTAGRFAARARALAQEFRDGLDDIARESDFKDIGKSIGGGDDWGESKDEAEEAADLADAELRAIEAVVAATPSSSPPISPPVEADIAGGSDADAPELGPGKGGAS